MSHTLMWRPRLPKLLPRCWALIVKSLATSVNVTNIAPVGPNATAEVATSGPKFIGPVSKQRMFVNQGGNWILSHDSALALLQAATG